MFRGDLRHIRTILETPNGSRPRFRSRQAPKPNTQIGRSPERGLTVGHVANSIQAACWASIFSAILGLLSNLVEVATSAKERIVGFFRRSDGLCAAALLQLKNLACKVPVRHTQHCSFLAEG